MTVTATLNPQDLITVHGAELRTDTQKVARAFGKQHHHLIQRIESLEAPEDFTIRNFSRMVTKASIGSGAAREVVSYEMTKDGFILLVMGFTGKKAMAVKVAYIEAFNAMAERLRQLQQPEAVPALPAKPVHPCEIPFDSPAVKLTLGRDAITQLNAVFGTMEFLDEEYWPKICALFPDINRKYASAFDALHEFLFLLKKERKQCKDISDRLFSRGRTAQLFK